MKELREHGDLTQRELRLLTALVVIGAMPEASTLTEKGEPSSFLDKAIRLANSTIADEEKRLFMPDQTPAERAYAAEQERKLHDQFMQKIADFNSKAFSDWETRRRLTNTVVISEVSGQGKSWFKRWKWFQ